MNLIRSEMLLGKPALEKLSSCSVAVFGLGGVGGSAVEALARLGIGEFHLIDPDTFNETNMNRQLLATNETLGKKKVEVAKNRILSINPDAKVHCYDEFFLPNKETNLDFSRFDFVVDAIDTISAKLEIIRRCAELHIPMASSLGMGNRMDPGQVKSGDLFETTHDPLAKALRKGCREMGVTSLRVVYSLEPPLEPKFRLASDGPSRRDVPGSLALVPPVAGYLLAHEALKALLGD